MQHACTRTTHRNKGLWSLLPVSSARCPFYPPYSLRSSPTGLDTPTGSRKKQLSCAEKPVTTPRWLRHSVRTHNNGKHCEFSEIIAQDCLCASFQSGWLVIHLSCALAMPRCFAKFLKRASSSQHAARLSLAFSTWKLSTGNS